MEPQELYGRWSRAVVHTGEDMPPRWGDLSTEERVAWKELADQVEPTRTVGGSKICPETGAMCTHQATCDGPSTVNCWLRHARRASEPEGRTTGLHRDSMG